MQLSSAPTQLVLPWANGGTKNTIPVPSQIFITPGAASWTDGMPPLTSVDPTSGGVPPARADLNGGLFEMSAVDVWMSAGAGFPYSSAFSTAVGGYPKGSRVLKGTGVGYWLSTADNNTTDPDTGGAGWIPDMAISGVYASAQQAVGAGTTKVLFDTVEFDALSQWDATDKRFVAKWAGIFRISGAIFMPAPPAGNLALEIFKNGSFWKVATEFPQVSDADLTIPFNVALSLAVSDYVDVYLSNGSGANVGQVGSNIGFVYNQFEFLGQ